MQCRTVLQISRGSCSTHLHRQLMHEKEEMGHGQHYTATNGQQVRRPCYVGMHGLTQAAVLSAQILDGGLLQALHLSRTQEILCSGFPGQERLCISSGTKVLQALDTPFIWEMAAANSPRHS